MWLFRSLNSQDVWLHYSLNCRNSMVQPDRREVAPPSLSREHVPQWQCEEPSADAHLRWAGASPASAWFPAGGWEHIFLIVQGGNKKDGQRKGEWMLGEAAWALAAEGSALGCPGMKGLLWRPGFFDFCARCAWTRFSQLVRWGDCAFPTVCPWLLGPRPAAICSVTGPLLWSSQLQDPGSSWE